MNKVLEIHYPETVLMPDNSPVKNLYPESHTDDMGETTIHYDLISDFMKMLKLFFAGNSDVFIAANLNLYYEQSQPKKYCIPDIMIAFGVPNHKRQVYKLWKEPLFPQVIFEVASESKWRKDLTDKVATYERLGAEEYYLLEPENAFLPLPLMAYRRDEFGRLRLVMTQNNRASSPLLKLKIVWTGEKFRLFDPQAQEFLLTTGELKAELDKLKAELKKRN